MSTESAFERYLYTRAAQRGVPISGTFELLPVCNLDCRMCYVKKSMAEVNRLGGLRSADEWLTLARKAVDAGMIYLLLTGGETFLFPEIHRLYSELHKMGLAIEINTNGTLIDEEVVSLLRRARPRFVKISLYGATEQAYQNLCGNGAAFYKVIHAFEELKRAGVIVYSSITATPSNVDELPEMRRICKEFQIPLKETAYMFPPPRSVRREGYRLSPERAAEVTLDIVRSENPEAFFLERAGHYALEAYDGLFSAQACDGACGEMTCRAGRSSFWIAWDGTMIPCAMMEQGKFPVMDGMDFMEAWQKNSALVKEIKTSPKCASCAAGKICVSCAASALCETGDTKGTPEYICRMMQHYIRRMREIHAQHTEKG